MSTLLIRKKRLNIRRKTFLFPLFCDKICPCPTLLPHNATSSSQPNLQLALSEVASTLGSEIPSRMLGKTRLVRVAEIATGLVASAMPISTAPRGWRERCFNHPLPTASPRKGAFFMQKKLFVSAIL